MAYLEEMEAVMETWLEGGIGGKFRSNGSCSGAAGNS
jgi:hypothetical protein